MRLPLSDSTNLDVLAGAANGANLLARFVAATAATSGPEVVFLDFRGVQVATSSFLREAVLGFRDFCRRSRPDLYPVVANANTVVLEELADLLQRNRDALVVCSLGEGETAQRARVVGTLEDKQRVTLRAVLEAGEADAATLAKLFEKQDPIGVTGWNNRLAALAAKGILRDVRGGRSKRFRPVVEGLSLGT
jgi:hypothetical protein